MSVLLYCQQQLHIPNARTVERQTTRLSCSYVGVYLSFHCAASQVFSMELYSTYILPKSLSIGRTFPESTEHNNSSSTASLGTLKHSQTELPPLSNSRKHYIYCRDKHKHKRTALRTMHTHTHA